MVDDHEYGVAPPDALNVRSYAIPVTPSGIDTVDTDNGANTPNDTGADWLRPSLSVTVTVNENDPVAVGVPDNTPVTASNVTPDGNDPAVTDHTYGVTPPDAVNDREYAVPVTAVPITGADNTNAADATDNDTTPCAERPPASVTRTVTV